LGYRHEKSSQRHCNRAIELTKTSAEIKSIALQSLVELGHTDAERSLAEFRTYLNIHGTDPVETAQALMQSHQLLCLGEMHDFAGRYMGASLITAAAQGGAQFLFIEVYQTSQFEIDEFVLTGAIESLPVSAGGGNEPPMRFQQPYVEMLCAARDAGMRIIAIDCEDGDFDERNRVMAQIIQTHLCDPALRGVAVVGQLHLVNRQIFGSAPSMSTRLRGMLNGSVVTIGRATPDTYPQFSVWADVAGVSQPKLLSTAHSPFETLPSTYGDETILGSDFDHIFFYPTEAVFD
jgi:hypothetical protein